MKLNKLILVFFVLGMLSSCDGNTVVEESVVEIHKEESTITVSVNSIVNFSDYIYGLDTDGNIVACSIDDSNLSLIIVGEYEVTCSIGSGIEATSDTLTVFVVDDIAPVITVLDSHISEYPINSEVDYLANIYVTDNYDTALDIVVDDSSVDYTHPGEYDVTYSVTDVAGNTTQRIVEYEFVSREAPLLDFDVSNIGNDALDVTYDISDENGTFSYVTMNVYNDGFKVFGETKTELNEMFTVDHLFSNRAYAIEVVMTYTLDKGNTHFEYTELRYIETLLKDVPEVTIDIESTSVDSIVVDVEIDDSDQILTNIELLLYDGMTVVDRTIIDEIGTYTFEALLSNHSYDVVAAYSYDTNEGIEDAIASNTLNCMTSIKSSPHIRFVSGEVTVTTIDFQYSILDTSDVIVDTYIFLKSMEDDILLGSGLLETNTHYLFEELECNTTYKVILSVNYDLNDGVGIQTMEFVRTFKTDLLAIVSITPNSPFIFEGNNLVFTIVVEDPSEMIPFLSIIVNNHGAVVTNIGEDTYQVVFEGIYLSLGTNTITVEGFQGVGIGGEIITFYVDENNTFDILVIQ
jgi:hypothetical protein